MRFSFAVAVMDIIGGWDKKKEDENQIGARFGACVWFYANAVSSPRRKDMKNFIHTLHSVTEAINKTWAVLHGADGWSQQDSMELQECKLLKSLQYDIDVPCIIQWELLWQSARSHLNEVLIKIGHFKKCCEK